MTGRAISTSGGHLPLQYVSAARQALAGARDQSPEVAVGSRPIQLSKF